MIVKLTGSTTFLVTLFLFEVSRNVAGAHEVLEKTNETFVRIGDSYYLIERKLKKNWFAAYGTCRQLQAELITLETLDELRLVSEYLLENKIFETYWTSGTDLGNNGKHAWFSNGLPLSTDLWYNGEPNNKNNEERCVELGSDLGSNKVPGINDRNCIFMISYICEEVQPKYNSCP
ncbi:C-type lectin 37Da [Drosophila simulans]|uniref:C-type lectin domain-containing protein n=1 Tax=Drosophila simulans TaxID=7240 RepID=A0A0J9QVN5_DROSI|nr:C-type lectin 37Da [Drosophila simulans]KMY88071.1 uncharacterized protein Dsimw501_GD28681 [Drosophila simulans]